MTEQQRGTTELPAVYRALHAHAEGVLREVVELHQPTNGAWQECGACNPDCDRGECWTVWPCPTSRLIADRLGISLA